MVVRLHAMDGKTRVYETDRGIVTGEGEHYSADKYVTKCGMEWDSAPRPYETCEHIDCALDIQRLKSEDRPIWFFIYLTIGIICLFVANSRGNWYLAGSGLSVLVGFISLINGIKAGDKFKELTEFKSKGTINGIIAYAATDSEELAKIKTAKECVAYGLAFHKKYRYDVAIEAFDKAIMLDPGSAVAWNNKGITLKAQNRYSDAILAYDRAIDLNPGLIDAWCNKGMALYDQDEYDEAILSYNEALKIKPKLAENNPEFAKAWYRKALALYSQKRYHEAVGAYDKAIEIDPENADIWYNRGMALRMIGCAIEATASLDRARDKWNSRGMDLSSQERCYEAIQAYDKALAIDSKYIDALINKGTVFYKWGRYEEAIASFNQVIEIDPFYGDAWSRKGIVLKKMGRKVEAADAFARARYPGIWLDPGSK